jgi:hypothetical protein
MAIAMLPVPDVAAQVPVEDSVVLTGGPASAGRFLVFEIDATSGPSGENPTGQVRFDAVVGAIRVENSGPVTCLAVRGNTAIINILDARIGVVTIQVEDGQPDTFDAGPTGAATGRAPTDCSPLEVPFVGERMVLGDIVVIDAQPVPTTKDQCKNGGWRNFPGFKSQGDCVSFVATKGKNPPAKAPS